MTNILTVPTVHFYQSIPGFFWFEECYRRLVAAMPVDRPSQWVEIGSFQGRSTAWLGVEIVNSRKPVTLYAVDSFVGVPGFSTGKELLAQFQTNTQPISAALGERFVVIPAPSLEAVNYFTDATLDVVFIDGDHEYEAVRADILSWWPKLKSGGWMAGDDFNMKPVADAVIEQFAPSGYILVHGWGTADGNMQPWPSWIARKE